MRKVLKPGIVFQIVILLVCGCMTVDESKFPSQEIAVEPEGAYYQSLLWLADGRLMVFEDLEEKDVFGLRWYFIAGESVPQELPLAEDNRCLRGGYYWTPSLLPDGRIGFIEQCVGPQGGDASVYLVAYDLRNNETKQIVNASLPMSTPVLINMQYSWNREMTLGMADNWGDAASIYWITPQGYEFPDITIEEKYEGELRGWSLLDNETALDDPEKIVKVGMARFPAWSPDGKTIAFMATVGPIGLQYAPRHNVAWNLYLMSPDSQKPQSVLADIRTPFVVKWSPDNRWLLIGAQIGMFGENGLWLYAPLSGKTTFVGNIVDPRVDWSPDGSQIAYFSCVKYGTNPFVDLGNCKQKSLNILDVSQITQAR